MVRYSACLCLLASATWVSGISLPMQKKRQTKTYGSFSLSGKTKVGTLLATDGGNYTSIGNFRDNRYTTTININGKDVLVALDTGSTDLWVLPPGGIGDFNDTGIPAQVLYGDGTYGIKGTIGVSQFQWGPYTVPQQAFINAESATIRGITDVGIYGLFGLGFNDPNASVINATLLKKYGPDATWGASVLDNVFSQNSSTPNFIAIDLSRSGNLEEIDGGVFTIGEYDSNFEAVKGSPKLEIFPKNSTRWTTLLERIEVNGKALDLSGHSKNPGVPSGQLNALLDTGAPTVGLPKEVIGAIYSQINGAVYDNIMDVWVVPCKESVDLEFVFGGQKYPVHALDLSIPQLVRVNGDNHTACISSFSSVDRLANVEFDVVLGDPFLRNVYTVYDFGDFTDNTGTATGQAYMQLLAETDASKVVEELVTARTKTLASMDPEIAPADLLRLLKQGSSNSQSDNNKAHTLADANSNNNNLLDGKFGGVRQYIWAVLGLLSANVLIGLILTILGCYMCVTRRGKRGSSVNIIGGQQPIYQPVKLDGY